MGKRRQRKSTTRARLVVGRRVNGKKLPAARNRGADATQIQRFAQKAPPSIYHLAGPTRTQRTRYENESAREAHTQSARQPRRKPKRLRTLLPTSPPHFTKKEINKPRHCNSKLGAGLGGRGVATSRRRVAPREDDDRLRPTKQRSERLEEDVEPSEAPSSPARAKSGRIIHHPLARAKHTVEGKGAKKRERRYQRKARRRERAGVASTPAHRKAPGLRTRGRRGANDVKPDAACRTKRRTSHTNAIAHARESKGRRRATKKDASSARARPPLTRKRAEKKKGIKVQKRHLARAKYAPHEEKETRTKRTSRNYTPASWATRAEGVVLPASLPLFPLSPPLTPFALPPTLPTLAAPAPDVEFEGVGVVREEFEVELFVVEGTLGAHHK
ncbi:hypothetical protein B0H16DRAFT_1467145 [Mycena metata]|uniref:Uncharacterized protein n=1 Tax=Mycena metata TaxID=1033252 RepID=A0AAD7I540_9AGAR|nr:hypothetical protein B0H16DRAFT_1467145 [Mycena metata]